MGITIQFPTFFLLSRHSCRAHRHAALSTARQIHETKNTGDENSSTCVL